MEVSRLNDDIFDDHLKYLQQLPANYMKKDAYKDKPCKEVLAIAATRNDKTLGIKTVNKATFTMSTLMAWAAKRGYGDRNHAEGRRVEDKRRASEKRKAYDAEDLKKLFSSPIYTTDIPLRKPEKFWLPLIGLFTGTRLNEICSLYVEDIREIDGIPCFDLNQNREDKKVKTDTSERIIPIHPTLIEVGFLDYVKNARERGQARLWPNLTWTKGNGYGGAFGQWYGRYIREHMTDDPQKVFHSFRHTLINGLKQKLVHVELIETIDGHVGSRAHDMTLRNYGKDYPPRTLLEALLKLDYQVELSSVRFPLQEV